MQDYFVNKHLKNKDNTNLHFWGHFLCAKQSPRPFTCVNAFYAHNNLVRYEGVKRCQCVLARYDYSSP